LDLRKEVQYKAIFVVPLDQKTKVKKKTKPKNESQKTIEMIMDELFLPVLF